MTANINVVIAYSLLLAGMPVFVGLFIGSFIVSPFSKLQRKIPNLERMHIQFQELLNGLAAAAAGTVLFRVCNLAPSLIAPVIIAAWISAYCFLSHRHLPNWLSWLGGFIVGWLVVQQVIFAS